jgi:predicted DNA binding CopG/RHH family protein
MAIKKKVKLDAEEQATLNAFEGLFDEAQIKSVPNVKKQIRHVKAIAKYSANKNKRVSLRMTEWDFNKLQEKALQEGLPYQTYLSSIIHKYLSKQLIEASSSSR